MTIRVLLVDDSAVIRGLINRALSEDNVIEVVGSAANGQMAIHAVTNLKPDIIILDIEMPVMDGITALPHLLKAYPPAKIIMASTLTQRNAEISLNALTLGAADYLAKPSTKSGQEVDDFYRELISKIKALAGIVEEIKPPVSGAKGEQKNLVEATPVTVPTPVVTQSDEPLALIGIQALAVASSTGGPQALLALFEQIKGRLTNIPIFITQHMPPTFTAILADHLRKAGAREVVEAKDGMEVTPGYAYVAPGDYHMVVEKQGSKIIIRTVQTPPENFCRPAADPMLRSLSAIYGKYLLVSVLTGMGQDGLEGAKIVVNNGGHIIAQDEASCIVYGMPKAVVENKLCRAVKPLPELGRYLIANIEGR